MRKKILVRGPVLSQSGYGEQSRFALRALRSREDLFDIYIIPVGWGQTGWVWEDNEFRTWMDTRILETQLQLQNKQNNFDMSLQVTIPNEFEKLAPYNIGYTAGIESDRVSPQWLQKSNENVDKILTVSNHGKNSLINTVVEATNTQTGEVFPYRLTVPVDTVWESTLRAETEDIPGFDPPCDFNFLTVSQLSPRKNFNNTITWWVEEFIDQEVGLIVKSNFKRNCVMDRDAMEDYLKNLLSKYPDRKCKVHLLHGDLSSGQMRSLYSHPKVKCLINLAHGEGFGLPMFEAAREGLPIVAIPWSGHMDFLSHEGKDYFSTVAYELLPIQKEAHWKGVLEPDSQWAFPEQGAYKMTLRKVKNNWQDSKDTATALQELILNNFDDETLYSIFVDSIIPGSSVKTNLENIPKISLITSVYNADEHIDQLMEDVTRQTIFEEKCEWILLNTDPAGKNYSEEVILKYKEKYPENIIYERLEEDPGIYGVWNKAVEMSSGEFISNVNCDDRRALWALASQANTLLRNSDSDLVYTDSYLVREPNIMFEKVSSTTERYNFEQFSKEAMLRGNLPHCNPMWRKSLHDKYGLFDTKYKSAGDWDFWLRCSYGGSKFIKSHELLGVYYYNPDGISTKTENEEWKKEEEREIFKTYLKIYQEEMAAK